jgi:anti-anti-sigma factor
MTLRKVSLTTWVFEMGDALTAAAEPALLDLHTRATRAGARLIVLNFSQLTYMNGGIGLLVMLLMRTTRQQQRMLAAGLSAHHQKIFELTRLHEAIPLYASEEEALVAAGI